MISRRRLRITLSAGSVGRVRGSSPRLVCMAAAVQLINSDGGTGRTRGALLPRGPFKQLWVARRAGFPLILVESVERVQGAYGELGVSGVDQHADLDLRGGDRQDV